MATLQPSLVKETQQMAKKLHAGSGLPHGHLHRGTRPQPSPQHGGTNLLKGQTRSPQPPQSWHAMAAASQRRK
jgi:hypothetical protein